jgi:hypothetical protein
MAMKKLAEGAAPAKKKEGRGTFVELFTIADGKIIPVGEFPQDISTEAKARSWLSKNGVEGTTYHIMRPVGEPITVKSVQVRRLV